MLKPQGLNAKIKIDALMEELMEIESYRVIITQFKKNPNNQKKISPRRLERTLAFFSSWEPRSNSLPDQNLRARDPPETSRFL